MVKYSALEIGEVCDMLPCEILLVLSYSNYLGPERLQTAG
jgi:hypothetical protein